MSRDIDAVPEREAELQMALAELIRAADLAKFWIDKTATTAQLDYTRLQGAIDRAQKTLIGK